VSGHPAINRTSGKEARGRRIQIDRVYILSFILVGPLARETVRDFGRGWRGVLGIQKEKLRESLQGRSREDIVHKTKGVSLKSTLPK